MAAKANGSGPAVPREDDLVIISNLQYNLGQLRHCRTFAGAMGGAVAGIMKVGVGFGLFIFALFTIMTGVFLQIKLKGQTERFFAKKYDVFTEACFSAVMTFILVWTLVYDTVHIF